MSGSGPEIPSLYLDLSQENNVWTKRGNFFFIYYYELQRAGMWKKRGRKAMKEVGDVVGGGWSESRGNRNDKREGEDEEEKKRWTPYKAWYKVYISFSPLCLEMLSPSTLPPHRLVWQHLNSVSHQSYLAGINQNLLPLSVRWLSSRRLSLPFSQPHKHTCTLKDCNRNQLGFQGRAAGQTGPFITLWWVLMKVGSGAAAVRREWGNNEGRWGGWLLLPHCTFQPMIVLKPSSLGQKVNFNSVFICSFWAFFMSMWGYMFIFLELYIFSHRHAYVILTLG